MKIPRHTGWLMVLAVALGLGLASHATAEPIPLDQGTQEQGVLQEAGAKEAGAADMKVTKDGGGTKPEEDDGCSVGAGRASAGGVLVLLGLALAPLALRRRRRS